VVVLAREGVGGEDERRMDRKDYEEEKGREEPSRSSARWRRGGVDRYRYVRRRTHKRQRGTSRHFEDQGPMNSEWNRKAKKKKTHKLERRESRRKEEGGGKGGREEMCVRERGSENVRMPFSQFSSTKKRQCDSGPRGAQVTCCFSKASTVPIRLSIQV
jgi:hypothetical protein